MCALETRCRIDVASERCAYALKVVEQALSGEVFRAVEAHVLEEVSETVLVGCFLDCAHMGDEIKLRALGRFVVMTYIIGHSIIELAGPDGFVDRELR